MKRLASILSVIFQPLFAPSMGLALLLNTDSVYGTLTPQYRWVLWLLTFLFTYFIPALFIFILSKLGHISSIKLENRKERYLPFGITLSSYAAGIYLLSRFNSPSIVTYIVIGAGLSIFIALMISFVWKISAHMTGIGGLVGAILVISLHLQQNYSVLLSIAILFAGLLGFARLELKAHTMRQVYAGFFLGFLSVFLTIVVSPIL